jgi:branched-chain amino acid transport system substrate-binding protein
MTDAVRLAAMEINQTGGIGGQPVQLFIEDVQTDPQLALRAVQSLYSVNGVQVIIGPATTQQVLTITNYLDSNHILLVTPSATAGALTGISPFVFRTSASDNLQTQAVSALVNAKGYQRVAIVTRNDAFGQGLAKSLQSQLGSKIVVTLLTQSGQSDYSTEMQQVKAARPDVIFYEEFVNDGIVIFKDVLNLGLDNIPAIGSRENRDPSFFKDPLVAKYMANTNFTGPTAVSQQGSYAYVSFANSFKKTFGYDPGLYTSQSYDAAMMAMMAIARAGLYDGAKIAAQMVPVSLHYVGPSGYLAMNTQGDITQVAFSLYRVVKTSTGYDFATVGAYDPTTGITLSS